MGKTGRKRFVSWLFWSFFAVVALFVLLPAGALLYLKINARETGELLGNTLSERLGHPVEVGGISFSLVPHMSLDLENIRVASGTGGEEPLLRAARLSVGIDPWQYLLEGRLRLEELSLAEAEIFLVTDREGRTSWELPRGDDGADDAGTGGWRQRPAIARLALGNSRILFRDHRSGRAEEIRIPELVIEDPGPGGQIRLRGEGHWRERVISLQGVVDDLVTGDGTLRLRPDLHLDGDLLSGHARGVAGGNPEHLADTLEGRLDLELAVADPVTLFALAGMAPGPDAGRWERLLLSARGEGSAGRYDLEALSLTINDLVISGPLRVSMPDGGSDAVRIHGRLVATAPQPLEDYAALFRLAPVNPRPADSAGSRGGPAAPSPVPLPVLDLGVDFGAGGLRTGGLLLDHAVLAAMAGDEGLKVVLEGKSLGPPGGGPGVVESPAVTVAVRDVRKAAAQVTFGGEMEGGPVGFTIRLDGRDEALQWDGPLALAATLAGPVTGSFRGNIPGDRQGIAGRLELSGKSLRALVLASGQPDPLPEQPGLLGAFAISGDLSVADGVTLGDMNIALDAIRGSGELSVATGQDRISLGGKLVFPELVPGPYLPSGPDPGPDASPASVREWDETPLDFSLLRALAPDIRIGVGRLEAGDFLARDLVLTARPGDSGPEFRAEWKMSGGQASASAILAGLSTATPGIRAEFDGTALPLAPLLSVAMDERRLDGKLDARFSLASRGASVAQMVRGLSGDGELRISDGTIYGIDPGNVVRTMASLGEPGVDPGAESEFSAASASWKIVDGVLENRDLAVAAPLFGIRGEGIVRLPPRDLDYRVTLAIVSPGGKAMPAIPVQVSGSWESPAFVPDLAELSPADLADIIETATSVDPGKLLDKALEKGVGSRLRDVVQLPLGEPEGEGGVKPQVKRQLDKALRDPGKALKSLEGLFK